MKCTNPNIIRVIKNPGDEKATVQFLGSGRAKLTDNDYRQSLLDAGCIEVPCGNCIGCRINYSQVWANRCYLESLCHDHTWFITLTYRDENLKLNKFGLPTLEKDAISKFMRALRDRLGHNHNIRYFGCGEYGDAKGERQGFNPHYHIIVFGAPLLDLVIDLPDMTKDKLPSGRYPIYRRKNQYGDFVYFSQTIYDCWQKGKIEVEEATWNTAAYVSRYVVKKQKGLSSNIYKRLDIVPEFIRMSNRPGIGSDWFQANKDKLLDSDYLSVKNGDKVNTQHPPRYFEKMMLKDEDSLEAVLMISNKINRRLASNKRLLDSTDKRLHGAKLEDLEEVQKTKSKLLKRSLT